MDIFILRYYDWDYEYGPIIGVFNDFNELIAVIFDTYPGRFDTIDIPKEDDVPYNIKLDDGNHGAALNIIKRKLGEIATTLIN